MLSSVSYLFVHQPHLPCPPAETTGPPFSIPAPMLHEPRVPFTGDAVDILAQRRMPDRPLVRCPLSCTLRWTDKEVQMELRLDLVGIVARDMKTSLEFYRRLGLDIPEGAEDEPHAEATTPSGLRVAWDSSELIKEDRPRVDRALRGIPCGARLPLPRPCKCRREVRGTRRPWLRAQRPLGRILGTAVRFRQ